MMRSPSRPRRRLARAIALAAVAGARLLGAQQPVDTALGRITFHVTESLADSTGRTRILLVAQAEKPDRCGLPLRARVASHGDTIVVDRWSQAPVMPPRRSGSRWSFDPESVSCLDDASSMRVSASYPLAWGLGTHTLVVRHLRTADRYRVTITGDAIRVAPAQPVARATILTDSLFWRVPPQSFVVACGTRNSDGWVCAELDRLLEREPGITPIELRSPNPYDDRTAGIGEGDAVPRRYFRARSAETVARDVDRLLGPYSAGACCDGIRITTWTGRSWGPR